MYNKLSKKLHSPSLAMETADLQLWVAGLVLAKQGNHLPFAALVGGKDGERIARLHFPQSCVLLLAILAEIKFWKSGRFVACLSHGFPSRLPKFKRRETLLEFCSWWMSCLLNLAVRSSLITTTGWRLGSFSVIQFLGFWFTHLEFWTD